MPFGLKNVINTFFILMVEIFKEMGDKFLKLFVVDFNIHNGTWENHLQHIHVVLQ
jgi:hypothetical protein